MSEEMQAQPEAVKQGALQIIREINQAKAEDQVDLWLAENNPDKPEGEERKQYEETVENTRQSIDNYDGAIQAVVEEVGLAEDEIPTAGLGQQVTVVDRRLQSVSNEIATLRLRARALSALKRPLDAVEKQTEELISLSDQLKIRRKQLAAEVAEAE